MAEVSTLEIMAQEEEILVQAVADTLQAYQAGNTIDNLRKWQAAKKALEEYQRKAAATGDAFATLADVERWVNVQGYLVSSRTVRNHAERVAGFPRKQKDGSYLKRDIEEYADRAWENPSRQSAVQDATDHGQRLKKALADEREWKVRQLQGSLLDAAEEEARDAAVLLGIRRHLEVTAPDRAKELIASISSDLTDEQRAALAARIPEIIERDLDRIADIFDRLAQAGGIQVED